jgi:hypothetical protein
MLPRPLCLTLGCRYTRGLTRKSILPLAALVRILGGEERGIAARTAHELRQLIGEIAND